MQGSFTFEEYLDERSKKDTKFVSLKDDESEEANTQTAGNKKNDSEFSISDEYDQEEPHTDVSKSASKKKWNREMAEEWYANTKMEIENRLHGDYLIPIAEEDLLPITE